ncbi:hypothetical protein [Rhizobium sp. PL01]|uniref:hypothetical protein n=1 Tax=Rhizobium sp. PL01 TaxID=3085631 RepID=UPI002982ADFE|nr:hypothetical protein [Rhizobium sp. PL01]MDW5314498.1 hypothetical protein [Rhizobium sp. PL01]
MDETYEMVGCIDFETDSYAISLPVLQKPRSNYVYIPKTDHHFIVIDFYEIDELNYRVHYLEDRMSVSISKKTPIPVLEAGHAYIIDADWTDAEVYARHPRLGGEAIKAFISLRSRMAAKTRSVAHGEVEAGIQDLLGNPVRSKYWISKFSALVRSAFESGDPSGELLKMMENARLRWIEKYSTKTSLKLVTQLMQVQNLTLQASDAKKVLLTRFEGILTTKGIYIPKAELAAYKELFPHGILPAIRDDAKDHYDYWSRGGQIGKLVNDQVYTLLNPADASQSRKHDPDRWSLLELERILLFFTVLGGDDHLLEQAGSFFHPLYEVLLADLLDYASDRYDWTSALAGRVRKGFLHGLSEITDMVPVDRVPENDEWMRIIAVILENLRKIEVLAKIVRPPLRSRDTQEVGIKGIDYSLFDALRKVYVTKNLQHIDVLRKADAGN